MGTNANYSWSDQLCQSDAPHDGELTSLGASVTVARPHAEIAGAGFAGLTVATALAQRGWSVRVHERAGEVRAFGAGIWIWENGVRVLAAIGAADEAFRDCPPAHEFLNWDPCSTSASRRPSPTGKAPRCR